MTAKNSLIAAGLRGHVFRSTDLGQSWQEIKLNHIATLNSVLTDDAGHVYLTGNAGTLLVSQDDGVTFTSMPTQDSKAILNAVGSQGSAGISDRSWNSNLSNQEAGIT